MRQNGSMSVELRQMTRELMYELYSGFEFDPAMFLDLDLYEKCRGHVFDKAEIDARFDKRAGDASYMSFAVMLEGRVIGEVVLKHIDHESKQCELGVHLISDSVKNKGYGTEAERLAIEYAFSELGMDTVLADSIVKNARSQHILHKLGFELLYEKDGFRYYKLEKVKYSG